MSSVTESSNENSDFDKPVYGTYLRMEWLKNCLYKNINNCINEEEIRLSVAWYLSCGTNMGFPNECLENLIKDTDDLYHILKTLSKDEILAGKCPPALRKGDIVEIIVNAKNLTYGKENSATNILKKF